MKEGIVVEFVSDIKHVPSTYTPMKGQTPEYWYRGFLADGGDKEFVIELSLLDKGLLENIKIGDKINYRGKI